MEQQALTELPVHAIVRSDITASTETSVAKLVAYAWPCWTLPLLAAITRSRCLRRKKTWNEPG